jgi:2-polyprenyl-3-methyl-5-hydroxy-6-metoxy-1,4-benzoquinol methylase
LPSKMRFLVRTLRHRLNRQKCYCPYCGPGSSVVLVRRKKVILNIMRCDTCRLVFRWPMDTTEDADSYYQDQYAPAYPQVHLPNDEELDRLTRSHFLDSPLDLAAKITVLKALRSCGRLLDFGCSWGYGTWQLAKSGYDVTGFEISRPRAAYAKTKLGVRTIDRFEELQSLPAGSFDVVFSNHVVEHLSNVRDVFDLMGRLLAPGGLAFHVLPNFLGRTALTGQWIMWIGEEHPLAPNIEFFRTVLPNHGFVNVQFGSSPFDGELVAGLTKTKADVRTDGDELLVLGHR